MHGLGQYERALTAAQQASDDTPELFVSDWATIELVEAAARAGRPDLAYPAFERLAADAAAAGTDWALGVTAQTRAGCTGRRFSG